jgi:hypothetical protein
MHPLATAFSQAKGLSNRTSTADATEHNRPATELWSALWAGYRGRSDSCPQELVNCARPEIGFWVINRADQHVALRNAVWPGDEVGRPVLEGLILENENLARV